MAVPLQNHCMTLHAPATFPALTSLCQLALIILAAIYMFTTKPCHQNKILFFCDLGLQTPKPLTSELVRKLTDVEG